MPSRTRSSGPEASATAPERPGAAHLDEIRQRPPDAEPGEEVEPDPRLTFANERTFLAWNRTALALVAGGLAAAQYLTVGADITRLVVSVVLVGLGLIASFGGYRVWRQNQDALRRGDPMPRSALPHILVYGIGVFALASLIAIIVHLA
jgi:putative membrane protein